MDRTRPMRLTLTPLLLAGAALLAPAGAARADQLIQIPLAERAPAPKIDYRHRIDGSNQGYGTVVLPAGSAYEVLARWNNGFRGDHGVEVGGMMQLLPDGIVTPGIAAGVWDVTNSGPMGRRFFLVLTKSLGPGQLGLPLGLGGAQATLGVGSGRFMGPLAGLKLNVAPFSSLVAEYDARQFNFGFWIYPLPLVQLRAELQGGDPYLGAEFRLGF